MAQTIKLKRSAVQGVIPTTSQLELGEVAINTYDGKMYIKKNVGGTESIVEVGATASFTPAGSDGQLQFNNNGALGATAQVYYDDVNNRLGVGTSTPSTSLHVDGTITTDAVQFDTAAAVTPAVGQLSWNAAAGTLDLGINNDVVLQVGQETHIHVKAAEAISDGDVVYASGAVGNSGQIEVSKFQATSSFDPERVVGIATQNIAVGEFGYITTFGTVRGISTDGSALTTPEVWVDGTILYASPNVAGELTSTLPTAPNPKIALAFVTSAHATNGSIAVRAYDLGVHMHDVHDVHITSVADNDIIAWNSTNSRWENTDIPTLVDSRYVNVTGDTMTGDLAISNAQPKLRLKETDTTNLDKELLTSAGSFYLRNLNDDNTPGINLFIVTDTGNATAVASYRAPIFYDSNNTGYYGNFAGTSVFDLLHLGGSQIQASSAKLQVNGFMRTGNIIVHDGGNTPNIAEQTIISATGGELYRAPSTGGGPYKLLDTGNYTSTLDARYVNVTGDTMTGTLAINNINASLQVGNVTSDIFTEIKHINTSGYGFTFQHANASLFINQQGGTNQVLVLGDVDAGSTTTLFGIGHSADAGVTWAPKLNFRGDAELFIGTSGTSRVFHDGYHPNADKWTTARTNTVTLTGDVIGTGSASVDGSGNWTVSLSSTVVDDSHNHSSYVQKSGDTMTGNLALNADLVFGNCRLYASGDNNHIHVNCPTALIPEGTTTSTNTGLGTSSYRWKDFYSGPIDVGNITTSGYLRGPANFVIDPAAHGDNTGTVVIAGNLQVDGTTTTINSTTVQVDDKNIELAVGSTNKAAADGAGITIDCGTDTDATLVYDGVADKWELNKRLVLNPGDAGAITPNASHDDLIIEGSANTGINIFSPNTSYQYLTFGDNQSSNSGYVRYQHSIDQMVLRAGGTDTVYIDNGQVGIGISSQAGKLHVVAAGGDQTASPDSPSLPDTTTAAALVLDGNYTDGKYRTRFAKIDRSANLPLYIQESRGTANSYSNLARFGSHSQSDHEFQVFGSARAEYFSTGGGTVISLDNENWTYRPHDIVYNGWRASTGDYTYLKAAGNSASGHGIAVVADNGFYVGVTDQETGALTDSATNPITTTWAKISSEGIRTNGNINVNSTFVLEGSEATLATTTQTQIASFSAATYGGGKFVITAKDGVNRHICELLVVHDGTTASATQYGSVFTSTELATYDVDISGGNVRILATSASANSTEYKVAETLMEA